MILAGDIGGTKTILAFFSGEGEPCNPLKEGFYLNQDYASIEDVIDAFVRGTQIPIAQASLGVAGPVVDGHCQTTNLPWTVDAPRISERFGIPSVRLLNDLEATAYGTLVLQEQDTVSLNPGRALRTGNRAVIAAGTGLGESILFWDGKRHRPAATEGGHSDFAPRNALEIELLEYLIGQFGHVSYERIVSGPGLIGVYRFLKETGRGEEPSWLSELLERGDPAATVSEFGLSGKAELCVKALDLFVSIYGSEAGNLALKSLATGGIYVGGGIAPKILDKLVDGTFVKSLVDKGRYAPLLAQIPVRVILNEKTALLGAAHYARWSGCSEEGS